MKLRHESYFINYKDNFYTLVIENEEREVIDTMDDRYENLVKQKV